MKAALTTSALAALLVAAAWCGAAPAGAQVARVPNVAGAERPYQTLPPAQPPAQPPAEPPAQPSGPRTGVNRHGVTNGAILPRAPRFRVEAVSFYAKNESGRTAGSDEVFAIFSDGPHRVVTEVFGGIDTGATRTFRANQTCVWPIHDPDDRSNGSWQCAAAGAPGPVRFHINLYDLDPEYGEVLDFFTGHFKTCVETDADPGVPNCAEDFSTLLFRYDGAWEVADILPRLDPACRCFEQIVNYRDEGWYSTVEYEVTIRITRVDAEPAGATLYPDGVAPPPIVHRSGALTAAAAADEGFEFDAGAIARSAESDLAFSRVATTTYLLTPNNGAKIWPGAATARGYAACYAARLTANYLTTPVPVPAVGQHACYITSDGRIGELRVTAFTPGAAATLTVAYTTWQ
jgi:hypothetical protein